MQISKNILKYIMEISQKTTKKPNMDLPSKPTPEDISKGSKVGIWKE